MRGGAHEGDGIAGKGRGEARRDVVPDEVALHAGVRVRFVVDPGEPAGRRKGVDGRARQREEGPQQRRTLAHRPLRRHRGKPLRAGTAQQLEQERLRLVVGVVRECDDIGVSGSVRRVPGCARPGFETLAGNAPDCGAMNR